MVQGSQGKVPVAPSVYVDQLVPAAPDWQQLLNSELQRAEVFVFICSRDAHDDRGTGDWVFHELRWWIANRQVAPLLIAPKAEGIQFVPEILRQKWRNNEVVLVDLSASEEHQEAQICRILGGIAYRLSDDVGRSANTSDGTSEIPGVYSWEKDRHFRYVRCNENYARAAGADSPAAMIGKSDDEMPWRDFADFFRAGDYGVICGRGPARFNVQETEIMADRVASILVNECQLLDHRGECIGVTGCFVDITGKVLVSSPQNVSAAPGNIALGPELGGEALSPTELKVLIELLRGLAINQIATELNVRDSEVISNLDTIRQKLQCRTTGDVIVAATQSGTQFKALGPILNPVGSIES
jgi:DNA-binding CsgD family transcriptional regulator/PAS domain-containing protein